ncbi:Uncharacterised protein [Mycobacteroides abscessus subsp. abscessus]|nr:Uncharacterised protein [Mycobacteroides abscessus subsp. abscessus]SKU22922.1 Uncharacterised protein [Mycobacteroides abscessus subsp. abscessus]
MHRHRLPFNALSRSPVWAGVSEAAVNTMPAVQKPH